jgi:hypothetical protein
MKRYNLFGVQFYYAIVAGKRRYRPLLAFGAAINCGNGRKRHMNEALRAVSVL